MFKFLKSCLSKEDQKIFDVTIKPYVVYSISNMIFIFMSDNNVGILNEDTANGLFISWITFTFVMLYTIGFKNVNK